MAIRVFLTSLLLASISCTGTAAAELAPWHPDADGRCLAPPYDAPTTPAQEAAAALVTRAKDILGDFPSLLATLGPAGPEVCLEDRKIEARGYLDVDRNILVLLDSLSETEALLILVHELRHVDQLTRGFCPANELSMQETARATFAIEADAQAITVLVGWSVREAGDGSLWDALLGQPKYADIALRFDREIAGGADVATAVAAAFDQWYESGWRVETYYLASCSDYLDRQDTAHKLPSYGTIGASFLDTLCHLPDGRSYPCAFPDDPVR